MRRALLALLALHALVLFAPFFAPYDPTLQNRRLPFAPPSRVRFVDADGRLRLRPFVYAQVEREGAQNVYDEDRTRAFPLRFFVKGRLFGVDGPARVFLLGSDALGRDQLSRLLYGGRISLLAGVLAAALALGIGLVLGTLAGFYGRWVDALLMRGAEVFLALPWLYLLFAVRAFLPLSVPPERAFLLLVVVIGLVDWARPARLVRGVVLSARERDFVLAARGFGASDFYLMRRHVTPQAAGVLLTQSALLVPQYVLAEVALSFLGLGVAEPAPSWGTMLAALQQYHVMSSYWWMWLPAAALVPVFLAYHRLADALHARARLS